MKKYIFVYGTLMKGFRNYKKYLKGKVITREPARVKGRLYHLKNKDYPGLIEGNDYINGELITIKDFSETIIRLDNLEGFYSTNKSHNEYNRILTDVEKIETAELVKAFLYQYNCQDKKELEEKNDYIPCGNWREYLKDRENPLNKI